MVKDNKEGFDLMDVMDEEELPNILDKEETEPIEEPKEDVDIDPKVEEPIVDEKEVEIPNEGLKDEPPEKEKDEPKDEDVESKAVSLEEENELLRQEIIGLAGRIQGNVDVPTMTSNIQTPKVEESVELASKAPSAVEKEPVKVSITNEDYDKAMTSPEGFVEVVNSILTRQAPVEVPKGLSMMDVKKAIQESNSLVNVRNAFFGDNPDLEKYSDYVGLIANDLSTSGKYDNYKDLLIDTEKEIRLKLNLPRKSLAIKDDTPSPAFPKGQKSVRTQKAIISEEQKDISDLITEDY